MQTVGVIVPISRMAGQLGRLATWLEQSIEFQNVEIYIIHDIQDELTSCDILNLIKRINSPRINFIEQKVGSPGLARNLGLDMVKEDWIVFWDSDDLGRIKELKRVIESASDVEVIICEFEVFQSDTLGLKRIHHSESWKQIAKSPGIWRFVFRKELVSEFRFSEFLMGEDQLFLAKLDLPNRVHLFSKNSIYQYVSDRRGSLTNLKNVKDLAKVVREELLLLALQESASRKFTMNMIVRQCVSLIKFGSFVEKKEGMKILIIIFLKFLQ